jgi:transcriptional regulator with XRE-family HTH domain
MPTVVHIGQKLKALRIEHALTQQELADRAGVTRTTVARLERNENEPHMTTARKLAEALGVHPRELTTRSVGAGDGRQNRPGSALPSR